MASPGTEPELLLARTATVSLALQALIERFISAGVLGPQDLGEMRQLGLTLVADMRMHGSTDAQIGAARLEHAVIEWWNVFDTAEVPTKHSNSEGHTIL